MRIRWPLLLCALFIGACGGGGGGDSGTPFFTGSAQNRVPVELAARVVQVESYTRPDTTAVEKALLRAPEQRRPIPGRVRLEALEVFMKGMASRAPGTPVRIGTARKVEATASAQGMKTMLAIRQDAGATTPAGAVSFTSPGASALRVGLLVNKLPPGARVRGYTQQGEVAFDVSGAEILAVIRRNRDAGDISEEGKTWWTPTIDNEEATLEISLPPGVAAEEVEVSVPVLSHIVVTKSGLEAFKGIGDAQTCQVDVTCRPEAEAASRATAKMTWVAGGYAYVCSGTLLNDSVSSGTPYFLTANHCISTQTAASSLVTYWFYRASSCNSGALSTRARQLNGGATLLYATSATDTSFVRLNANPPADATFSGWTTTPPPTGLAVTAVHHPQGDLQKFSQGQLTDNRNCTPIDLQGAASCTPAPGTGSFLGARWSLGTTEGGSSGSGLFSTANGSSYLMGQLMGGTATCQRPDGHDTYGRFDLAYAQSLSRWLSPAMPVTPREAVYRFYNASTGAHFFTRNTAERDGVIAANPAFRYEGVAYYAYGTQVTGSSPVFRFYNHRTGRHFYTISEAERDWVASNPDYIYEGVSWYAQDGSGGSASALHRFYNATAATHFYTISTGEKDYVVLEIPAYRLEGVGYYAWMTQ